MIYCPAFLPYCRCAAVRGKLRTPYVSCRRSGAGENDPGTNTREVPDESRLPPLRSRQCRRRIRLRRSPGGGATATLNPISLISRARAMQDQWWKGAKPGGVGWHPAYLVERHEVFGYGREGGGGGFFYEVSGGVSFDGRASRRRIVLLLFGIARRCSSTSGIRIIAAAAAAAPLLLLLQPPLIRPPHPILPPPSPLLLHDPVHHAQLPFLCGPRSTGIVAQYSPRLHESLVHGRDHRA